PSPRAPRHPHPPSLIPHPVDHGRRRPRLRPSHARRRGGAGAGGSARCDLGRDLRPQSVRRAGRPGGRIPSRCFLAYVCGAVTREPLIVRVDGVELAVDMRGAGPPLLFVHGFPFDHTMWKHQLAGLTRWRRIAPDLRGAGASSAPASGYSMRRYADDLAAVLDGVGVEQAVVCGLSLGGYVLFELLRRHPDRVRAAIFCDTKAEPDSDEAKRGRDDLAAVAQRHGQTAVADRLVPNLLAPQTLENQPDVVRHVREMIQRMSLSGMVGALRALRERPDSRPTLPTVGVPTLVLGGEADRISPPSVMEAIAAATPRAR